MPSISFGSVDVPQDLLPAINLMEFPDIPEYLEKFGFDVESATKWRDATVKIELKLTDKKEFDRHTWYTLQCVIIDPDVPGPDGRKTWSVKRRLEHLRTHLHDRVKADLGQETYDRRFGSTRFAHRLGVPGTTERVNAWLATLAGHVNAGRVPPMVCAQLMRFLAAPDPDGVEPPAAGGSRPCTPSVVGRPAEGAPGASSPMAPDVDAPDRGVREIDISAFRPDAFSRQGTGTTIASTAKM